MSSKRFTYSLLGVLAIIVLVAAVSPIITGKVGQNSASSVPIMDYTYDTAHSLEQYQYSDPSSDGARELLEPVILFVTTSTYNGDLNGDLPTGLAGADLKCQQRADAAGLDGTYLALLSANNMNAKDRVADLNAPVFRIDGAPLVFAAKNLFDRTNLLNEIQTENGRVLRLSCIWTGSTTLGINKAPWVCHDWTSKAGGSTGWVGITTLITSRWLSFSEVHCDRRCRLYCFKYTG